MRFFAAGRGAVVEVAVVDLQIGAASGVELVAHLLQRWPGSIRYVVFHSAYRWVPDEAIEVPFVFVRKGRTSVQAVVRSLLHGGRANARV